MNSEQTEERYSRQQDIVPSEKIAKCKATVVGVGANGPGQRIYNPGHFRNQATPYHLAPFLRHIWLVMTSGMNVCGKP